MTLKISRLDWVIENDEDGEPIAWFTNEEAANLWLDENDPQAEMNYRLAFYNPVRPSLYYDSISLPAWKASREIIVIETEPDLIQASFEFSKDQDNTTYVDNWVGVLSLKAGSNFYCIAGAGLTEETAKSNAWDNLYAYLESELDNYDIAAINMYKAEQAKGRIME